MSIAVEDIIDPMIMFGYTPSRDQAKGFLSEVFDPKGRGCSAKGSLAFLKKNLKDTSQIPYVYGASLDFVNGIEAGWEGWQWRKNDALSEGNTEFLRGFEIGEAAYGAMRNPPKER